MAFSKPVSGDLVKRLASEKIAGIAASSDETLAGGVAVAEWIHRVTSNKKLAVVRGATACGKTTEIPAAFLKNHVDRKGVVVYVTNKKAVCLQAAADMSDKNKLGEVGGIVGVQVGRHKCVSQDTKIVCLSAGVFLNYFKNEAFL